MSAPQPPLFAMLSELLIAYTYDVAAELTRELREEPEAPPSLAMWANVLQFVSTEGIGLHELLALCGIAKPTLKTALDCLKRHGWITIDPTDFIRLTPRGMRAHHAFPKANDAIERAWESQWGVDAVRALRTALQTGMSHIEGRFPQYPMPAPHRGALPRGE